MSSNNHWMVTLQELFYPALAKVGIPCKIWSGKYQLFSSANTITFLVIWKRSCMLSRSSSDYLMAISVVDNLVLIFIVVLELSRKYYQRELFWSFEPWRSLRDVFYGAYNAPTWLVVLFTAECFFLQFPHTWKIKTKICTQTCAVWTVVTAFVVSHLSAVPYFWSNASIQENNHRSCVYKQEAPTQFIHTLVWLQTLQAYILPFVVILSLNGLTLRLISSRVHSSADVTSGKVRPLLRSRWRKSVLLLVTVSMSFVMLSITRATTQIILGTTDMYTWDRDDYELVVNIAADIGTMLCLSNAAVNMYLYVCTQPKFRREFLACIRKFLCFCLSFVKHFSPKMG
uniref:G-protein coupled receptors family 1 profile domain-containing protein n=1 Tax=Poecilia formosa TaxID=48698 RepID=A0A096M2D4_POEFO